MDKNTIIGELRARALLGQSPASLLRVLQELLGQRHCEITSIQCFREAFGAGIASISAIGGWTGFGGELSDAQIDALVQPVLDAFRSTH
jgi:hypothetical protein